MRLLFYGYRHQTTVKERYMKQFNALILLALITCSQDIYTAPIDLTIGIQEGGGFFAELHKVMQCLIYYEKDLSQVHVDWSDEFFPYKDGAHENGWNLFFEPIQLSQKRFQSEDTKKIIENSTANHHELHDQCCTAPWIAYDQYLPYRKFVHEKLTRYIRLKPEIQAQWDEFYTANMKGYTCIGVHARIARQHAWLVPGKRLPQVADYCKEIDRLIRQHRGEPVKLFVASDSHQAIQQFKERYKEKIVCIEAFRSDKDQDPCIMYTSGEYLKKNKDVWHEKKHQYFGGLTTLLDCLLLSKCDYMIHTTSNLAFFAAYYNPEVKSIYLPKGVPLKQCAMKDNPRIVNPLLNPEG